jgi:hypothetical protein
VIFEPVPAPGSIDATSRSSLIDIDERGMRPVHHVGRAAVSVMTDSILPVVGSDEQGDEEVSDCESGNRERDVREEALGLAGLGGLGVHGDFLSLVWVV